MELLSHLFPSSDFTLLGVILALPLLGAIGNGLFGKRLGKEAVTLMALSAIGLAFVAALVGFFMLTQSGGHGHSEHAAEVVRFKWVAWEWMNISGVGDAKVFRSIPLQVAFSVDALNGTMSLIITGIGFLIHLYSSKYMEDEPGYYRFFTYLNLFIFSMLVLVLGDSLPVLFVGWEGVGLCSYLLIGFWFSEDANASAGKKAFITNRIGDFGLLVAMGLLAYYVGALDWAGIDAGKDALFQPVKIWPVADSVPVADAIGGSFAKLVNTPLYVSAATLVGLAIFLGCAGKSAQIPLYVWLPDAMAGPTPVSALIHAATMVTAGVYLICRMSGVFLLSPMAMFVVALTGVITALFAATIAFVQNDIKKVLAYSTVSQLGFMFLGVGVGAFTAGFFHVMTHAFFKACMFLGSGSVIHAMHARIHGTDPSQDMRHMGGLRKYMPVTFLTFLAGWAAIVGLPLTSGFFSKDEILFKAKTSLVTGPKVIVSRAANVEIDNFIWQPWHGTMLYVLGACAAIMTAFYMTRLMFLTFGGEFRGWSIVPGWTDPHAAHAHDAHGHDAHAHDDHGHDAHDAHHHHEEPGPNMQGPEPHESPWQMTLPLVILGFLSLTAGFLNAAPFHIEPLHHFLHPLFHGADEVVKTVEGGEGFMWIGLGIAVVLFATGVGAATWIYHVQKGAPAKQLAEQFPRLHALVYDKWRIDELYQETVIGSLDSLAQMSVWADKYLVDGILARLSTFLVQLSGSILRQFQTGRLQAYAAIMVLGLGAVGCYVVRPHAAVQAKFDRSAGTYALTAAPGFGFTYRWDVDGKDGWDSKGGEFGSTASTSVALKPDEVRKVKVEVQNPLGFTSKREMTLVREREDASVPIRLDVMPGADGKLQGIPSGAPPTGGLPPNHPSRADIQRALEQGGH